jgi:predicted aspartyl protease
MILDTGASHTTIDFTALYMAGHEFGQAIKTTQIETANGIIDANIFEIESLRALGYTVQQIPVQVYDFLAHGILSDYDGMLGLDFFENTVLTIDMENCTLEINPETSAQIVALKEENAELSDRNSELQRLLQQAGISIPSPK